MEKQNEKRTWTISVCAIHLLLMLLLNELFAYWGNTTNSGNISYSIRFFDVYPLYALSQLALLVPVIFLVLLLLTQVLPENARVVIKIAAGILAGLAALSVLSGFLSYYFEKDKPYIFSGGIPYDLSPLLLVVFYIDRIFVAIIYRRIATVLLQKDESKTADCCVLRVVSFIFIGIVMFSVIIAGNAVVTDAILPRLIKSIFLIHALTRFPLTLIKRERATVYPAKSAALVVVALAVLLGIGALINSITPDSNHSDKGGKCVVCGEHTRWIYRNGRWYCRSCSNGFD